MDVSQRLGMHSLKILLLSWLAKAGISLEVRNLLGYHSSGAAESSLLYARDALAGPLRELHTVLIHVRSGRFDPDETRSGRWMLERPVQPEEAGESTKENAKTKIGMPGIDYESISVVEIDFSENEVEGEDDGFGNDLRHTCTTCQTRHDSLRTIWECDSCNTSGCSECLRLFRLLGQLVCERCHTNMNPGNVEIPSDTRESLPDSDSSDGSDSDSDSVCSSVAEDGAEEVAAEAIAAIQLGRQPARNPDEFFVQHLELKALHFLRRSEFELGPFEGELSREPKAHIGKVMACGRVVSDKYRVLHTIPNFRHPQCKVCFGTKP